MRALLPLLLVATGCSRPPAQPERPNFVVIDIDSFMASRLGAVRHGQPVTPTMDALAARGARFDQAFAQSGWTLPALTALLSGSHPLPPAVRGEALAWRAADSPDLPTILGYYGYTTVSSWRSTLIGSMRGPLVRGFGEVWPIPGHPEGGPLDSPIRWLSNSPPEPFLLFVQDLDLHDPNALRNPWPGFEPQRPRMWIDAFRAQQDDPDIVDRLQARYDANLHSYDARLSELVATLERESLADHTVLVVLSNHGEDMFVHAYGDHGQLYDTVLRFPLVIADPAMPDPGRVIDTVVQAVDVAPTILARAGIVPDQRMDGLSLLPLTGQGDGAYRERVVYSLTDGCNAALRSEDWKLLIRDADPRVDWTPMRAAGGVGLPEAVELSTFLAAQHIERAALPDCASERETISQGDGQHGHKQAPPTGGIKPSDERTGLFIELFDLASDPRESINLALERPDKAVPMATTLLDWLSTRRHAAAGAPREALSPEQVKTLQDQGYWGFMQPPRDAP